MTDHVGEATTMIDLDALEHQLRSGEKFTNGTRIAGATTIRRLRAELKEARGLLKPFAVYYEINDLDERAADDAIEVPVGDLRLARAFLARNGKGEG